MHLAVIIEVKIFACGLFRIRSYRYRKVLVRQRLVNVADDFADSAFEHERRIYAAKHIRKRVRISHDVLKHLPSHRDEPSTTIMEAIIAAPAMNQICDCPKIPSVRTGMATPILLVEFNEVVGRQPTQSST